MITSIKEILEKSGKTANIKNPWFMSQMVKELKSKGYIPGTRVIDGKRRRVWISPDEAKPADLVKAVIEAMEEVN